MMMIKVVAAIIIDDNKVFATQRGYGDFKGGWEFPGGKVEANETPEDALKREIMEELNVSIDIKEFLHTVEYDYPKFHLSMDCFISSIVSGELVLKEHEGAKWLTKDALYSVDWLPADIELIPLIEKVL
ncbi:MAG: (deoxy)nucleoside triphosphate pyrophosphohydrolase [Bacilli bacterium]|nr:(deoxy)nucleoside triphosphate pyrophosphohydrolase [Bacilli bacterium]